MRERLSPGTIITLNCDGAPRQFQIDAVIGDGASCIAYDAHRTDGNGASLRYRLKECYPFHAQIERKGAQLFWASDSEKQAAFRRLERSHRLIVKLCNDKSVGNNITRAELCEGNGTLYAVMDVNHAKTYAFDDDQNLHSILDTMRVLTEVVGNLHAQGYLHLDIKPDNFLVSHRPSTNVWLFDVDSLASMDDLKSGAGQSISYSQQWAAPEQLLGQTGKLCEATDLFAIGAVLFEKIMGRQVQNDDMGLFADWDFDGAMFDHVNPKVKRYLREIFRKTLAASVKRRYQSAGELLENLEKACDITIEGKPFLKSDRPVLTTQFVGRQRELLEIRDAFHSGTHAVFLHGIGGIGKSTLALAYGNQFQKEYDAVIFCRYRDSLEELFEEIEVQNFDGSDKEHSKYLRRLLDENTLLIIDNFDVEIDADDFLDELMRLKCSILFTSRTDFSSVYSGNVKQIEVNALPYEKLAELFSSICGWKLESEEEQQSFHKLLKMVDGHTYFVELAAKQIVASGCSLDALYTALRNGISGLHGKEKVRTQKDGRIVKRTIPEILRVLFRVADLNRGQQQVLRNLYALRFIHVDKKIYWHFVCASISKKNRHENVWSWISFEDQTRDDFDILNDLVELGWVQKNGSHFSLHPLIEELISSEQSPCPENCTALYLHIAQIIEKWGPDSYLGSDDANEYEYDFDCEFLCSFFKCADFSISSNRKVAVDWLLELCEQYDYGMTIGGPESSCFKSLYEKLSACVNQFNLEPQEVFQIRYIVFFAWLSEFRFIYCGEPAENQRRNALREKQAVASFDMAFQTAKQLSEDKVLMLYDAVKTHIRQSYFFQNLPVNFIHHIYAIKPHSFDFEPEKKVLYELPMTEAEKESIEEKWRVYAEEHPCRQKDEELEQWQNYIEQLEADFNGSTSKVEFAHQVAENKELEIFQRVAIMERLFDQYMEPLFTHYSKESQNTVIAYFNHFDFNTASKILDISEELLTSQEWENLRWKEGEDYEEYDLYSNKFFCNRDGHCSHKSISRMNLVHDQHSLMAIKALMSANRSEFQSALMPYAGQMVCHEFHAPYFDCWGIQNLCHSIGKCHYILPIMAEAIYQSGYDLEDEDDARSLISCFDQVLSYAIEACKEIGEDDPEWQEDDSIRKDFKSRIEKSANKNYQLRNRDEF